MLDHSTSLTDKPMGAFWSGEKLRDTQSVVDGFDPNQIDVNSYNLRMGSVYFKTADETGVPQGKVPLSPKQCFLIPPGQFAFLLTKESIAVPSDAMAFISMRTRIKYQGLINVSGFHVDPGYKGHLIYAVYNASPSPIQICEDDQAFKIWFCSLDRASNLPYIYSGKEITDIDNELVRGMSREVLSLQGLSDKIRTLQSDIDRRFSEQKPIIDGLDTTWKNINFGVVVALVVSLFTLAAPTLWELGKAGASYVRAYITSDDPVPGSPPTSLAPPSTEGLPG